MSQAMMTPKIPNPEMYDEYETGEWVPPPQAKGMVNGQVAYIPYMATLPTTDKYTFDTDKHGYWRCIIDGITLEGGYQMKKVYLSSKPFDRRDKSGAVVGLRNMSAFGNFLRACGLAVRPQTVAEYEAFALSTAGQQVQLTLEWEAYDGEAGITVADRWEAFPEEAGGVRQPYIEVKGKRFWARAGVKRFIDALKG